MGKASKASSGRRFGLLKAYWNVARLEYLPAEAPALLVPLLLGTSTLTGLLNYNWLEAVLAFALLYTSGFIINSYNDIEVDLRWKTRVANGARSIGRKSLLMLFVGQITVAALLGIHLSWTLGTWYPFALILVGVFFATAYSLPPLHLKVRGIWHVISLCASAFTVPFIFFALVVMHNVPMPIAIFIIGFTVAHYGIALANQTGDYLDDKAEGLTTPAVKWGLDRTLTLAKTMTITGGGILLSGMFLFILTAPWLSSFEASVSFLPFPGRYGLFSIIALVLITGYSVPTRGLFNLHTISALPESIEKRMDAIKNRLNYPKWQASGIWSLALAATLLFSIGIAF